MSVASEITRLQDAKSALKTSIEAKGVTVSDSTLISGYSALVDQIPTGGGGGQAEEDLINLIEKDIKTLNIPSGTRQIGEYAFYYCRGLTSVTIPDSVTSIGSSAFKNCTSLTSINIPNSVAYIKSSAFSYCRALRSINSENEGEAIMLDSLTYFSNDCFNNSDLIKMVYLTYNGVVDSGYTNMLVDTNYQNFIVYVPQEQYGNYWKKYYDSRGLILPYPRVESTNHTIQYTINSTGSQQVSVIYSDSLKFVEKMTINGTEVENPKNSTQQLVDGENVIKVWLYDSRIINNKLLYNNISINSVEIQNSVTTIGNYTFYYCEGLTSINIPNGVTTIGGSAFDNCSALTSVTIGNGVTSIGNSTFQSCSGMTSVTINATTPPSLGSNVFYDTNNCPIYVPAESVDAYKTATNWKTYASRIQAIPTE